jgi:hypothetical protein
MGGDSSTRSRMPGLVEELLSLVLGFLPAARDHRNYAAGSIRVVIAIRFQALITVIAHTS